MIAPNPMRRHGAARLLAVAGLTLAIAGCAETNKVLTVHETAAGPACPATPSEATPELGCANKANLAAMVADPADLVRGRAETPAVGAREAAAVENLKKGPEKAASSVAPGTLITTNLGNR